MLKKRNVVHNTVELYSMLSNPSELIEGDVLFRSDEYIQLGCDLRDLPSLHSALSSVIDLERYKVLLTAEVSITYMKLEESNALIHWASSLPEAHFCLLEQILPEGSTHPFAETMMAHFEKLQTPLGAVNQYPTARSQENRFASLGWTGVEARNLWKLWSDPNFLTRQDRLSLDIEPFDEWEEFAIFGAHYFLLTADNLKGRDSRGTSATVSYNPGLVNAQESSLGVQSSVTYCENPKSEGRRRFGAAFAISSSRRTTDAVAHFGGMGLHTRTNSMDIYSSQGRISKQEGSYESVPQARMCHTVTDMGAHGALLVGGRTSPDNAFRDCWIYHKFSDRYEKVDDLPYPLYRHSAVHLNDDCVLTSPGKSSSQIIENQFLVWNRAFGWRTCAIEGDNSPSSTYGATLFKFAGSLGSEPVGVLAGGLSDEGILSQDKWKWVLWRQPGKTPIIRFSRLVDHSSGAEQPSIARFGASTVFHKGTNYIVGGIVKNEALGPASEICRFEDDQSEGGITKPLGIYFQQPSLMIGSSVISFDDQIVIMGGGAVCFSFGTFWNKGCYNMAVPRLEEDTVTRVEYRGTVFPTGKDKVAFQSEIFEQRPVVAIPRVKLQSSQDFDRLLKENRPVILEGLSLGSCLEQWTPTYLKEKIAREVVIHEATEAHMDFKSKNFKYTTMPFADCIDRAESGGRLYLRSLSADKPSELPADISKDFPSIAADFQLPPELSVITQTFHSSPLRISGDVNVWLHYDVMANVLCQIRGSKRLLLFPPTDVKHFDIEPGSSNSSMNVFEKLQEGSFGDVHPHEVLLSPGDILFLPQLWLHTAAPASGTSIAVNVFFKGLQASRYASGKDVYGNRDLQAYEKGRQDVTKIIKSFDNLPNDVRAFYLSRLADEFAQSCKN
ncbi:leucine carboxyl methyltransferas-like protein 2 [Calycina marina]|uniref:tRNA wybutosine-synthesizing protein 4 n=1 Tax=Calycina marina TaxID=1763456 RepID=A0A9P7ZA41_9HELO|nr:leucine carboxyl methyltransferas-like protein 2 [Calycina marina]